MINEVLLLLAGFALLIKGADWLVDGASSVAKRHQISELTIGLTLVAFGTSSPELIINTVGSVYGLSDVVTGNVIGSNIFNLMLILGLSGIITPIMVQTKTVWKEIPFSLFAVLILFFLLNDKLFHISEKSMLSRLDGGILILFFILFLVYIYRNLRSDRAESIEVREFILSKSLFLIGIGLIALIAGGRIVVRNAVDIAHAFHLSEKFIGLTIISAGTSLPELATSVVAAFKKKSDMAIGNVIGSNIFNIFLVLGTSAVIRPISFNVSFNVDLAILSFTTIILFIAMFTGVRKKLDRWEAIILFLFFGGYLAFLFFH